MGIFTRLFGRPAPVRTFPLSKPAAMSDSKLPDSVPGDSTRRELVHVALSDIRRRHGIPTAWLDCNVIAMPDRERQPQLLVQLLILQWDERLLKYSLAIQRQLTVQLIRLDPASSQWLQGVVWQYAPGTTSPFMSMPDRKVWAVHPSGVPAKHDVLDRRVFSRTGSLFPRHLDRRRDLHKEPKNELEIGVQRSGQGDGQNGHQKTAIFQRGELGEQEFPETRRVGL